MTRKREKPFFSPFNKDGFEGKSNVSKMDKDQHGKPSKDSSKKDAEFFGSLSKSCANSDSVDGKKSMNKSNEKLKDKSKDKEKSKDKNKSISKDKDSSQEKRKDDHSTKSKEKEKETSKDKVKNKSKEKEKEVSKDKVKDKDKKKDKNKDKSKEKDKESSQDKRKDDHSAKTKDKETSKDKVKNKSKEKEKEVSKDKNKVKEREKSKEKLSSKEKEDSKKKVKGNKEKAKEKCNSSLDNVKENSKSSEFSQSKEDENDRKKLKGTSKKSKSSANESYTKVSKKWGSSVTSADRISKSLEQSKEKIKEKRKQKKDDPISVKSDDNLSERKINKKNRRSSSEDFSFKSAASTSGGKKKHKKVHSKVESKKSKKNRSPAESQTSVLPYDVSKLSLKIHKIESFQGATMVLNESAINSAGYAIDRVKLASTEYSQVFRAHKLKNPPKSRVKSRSNSKEQPIRLVVKITNLTECSPRFRSNLVNNSVRIMRYIGNANKKPLSSLFIKIYQVFQMESVKLYIFMEECVTNKSLYDMVKSNEPVKAEDIRNYIKAITSGIKELQLIGVAHRYLKLQHILFDTAGNPKLCGWSKSVFYYDPDKKRILLQRKERRVRRNYFLPPEAFERSYDPAKADIWSIGVILVAMSTKRYPFNVRDVVTKFSTQWRQFVKRHQMNTFVRNLCNRIFIIDPKNRISATKILEDKYFKVPKTKIFPLSIRADPKTVDRESSRVGGVSAIDIDASPALKEPEYVQENQTSKQPQQPQGYEEEAEDNGAMEGEEDGGGNMQVDDGGGVGEEENLPKDEALVESQMAEKAAPEEAENEAIPEDGGMADIEYDQQQLEGYYDQENQQEE